MSDHFHLKDHYGEIAGFRRRVMIAVLAIMMLLGVLVFRFYDLQVLNHRDYATQSDRNRVQVQAVPPKRGLIFDRDGNLLAENMPSYTLSIVKEKVHDLDETLERLGAIVAVSDQNIEKFRKRLSQRRRPHEPVPLRYKLTEQEIAALAVEEYALPGVEVVAELVRSYPQSKLLAHNLGYVGRINDRELSSFDEEEYQHYSGTHTIGKIGLEHYYERVLLGEVGSEQVEINARGRVLRVLDRVDPIPGEDLTLHLDLDVQKAAYDALGDYRGAVVAMDVHSGGVLAIVSKPSFDPNLFVTGISYKDYNELNNSLDLPLFNRAIQAQYPPGSTVKPMLALGGLYYGVIDGNSRVRDPGFYQLQNQERRFRDWKKGGHGEWVNMHTAIVESCDVFYYDMAFRMGIDRMNPFGEEFGLGNLTGVDISNERKGLWPSREWKREARGLPWFPGDSLNVGIGQGDSLTTPLQLAAMMAMTANRGTYYQPQMVKQIGANPVEPVITHKVDVKDEHWDLAFDAMIDVVHSIKGTARVISRGLDYKIAGKTGTAQVVGIAQDAEYDSESLLERQRDHALFVAFAPADNPKIAVAVIAENGEHGSSAAAPIARAVTDAYMNKYRADSTP